MTTPIIRAITRPFRRRSRIRPTADHWATIAEYAIRDDAAWHLVHPAHDARRRPPRQHGSRTVSFTGMLADRFPDAGVLEVRGGTLLGRRGWLLGADGRLIPEISWYGNDVARMPLGGQSYRVTRLAGVMASLATDFADHNYGHFLLDGLGRFGLLTGAGIDPQAIDHVYCTAPSARAARLFDRLGIPVSKRVIARPGVALSADTILAPSFPGRARDYPRWLVEDLRRELGSRVPHDGGAPGSQRRLYVRRTVSRRIDNEPDVLPLLADAGFEAYDPLADPDPPATFAQAAAVVGVHGANLADLVFCRPGTRVLELMPSGHALPYWYTLSESADLDYGYLVVDSTEQLAPGAKMPGEADVRVDLAELAAALAATVDGLPAP